MKDFSRFTNCYSLSKTLRFELRPVGKTLEYIQNAGFLAEDEQRAEDYKKMKKIMDRYHKQFIEESLIKVEHEKLNVELQNYIKVKDDKDKKKTSQGNLRNIIIKCFNTERLLGKKLIKEELEKMNLTDKERALIESFKNWTTYFTGFNKNRRNLYTNEEKITAIAYRLINDNLPKFINNIKVFEEIKTIITDIDDTYFKIENYSNFLTQSKIDKYNEMIGGYTEKDGIKIQGLNEKINLHNQRNNNKLPKFTPLYKMILSDKEKLSWLPEKFEDSRELLEAVSEYYKSASEIIEELRKILKKLEECDLNKIYIKNDTGLTDISKRIFKNWNEIADRIKNTYQQKSKEKQEKYQERTEKEFNKQDSFSIAFIDNIIKSNSVKDYFLKTDKFDIITKKYANVQNLLATKYEGDLKQKDGDVEKLKEFLDSINELLWFVKPLSGTGEESNRDTLFYGEFEKLYTKLAKIIPLYNKVRNYVTQKPYSTEKIKLNFSNSTLAAGWDRNKEKDNTTILLRKDGCYYLAIMNKSQNRLFKNIEESQKEPCYEKMEYKLLQEPYKMLPKVFFPKKRKAEYQAPQDLANKETRKNDSKKLIDFYKTNIPKYNNGDWRVFDFKFKNTNDYVDINDFYKDVEIQGYKITFKNISEKFINEQVENGFLYLFQIYNKDFSGYSKGTPNMHTLYWKELFSAENLKDVIYKLNGKAEIFYRKKSLNYDETILSKGHHAEVLKNKFKYPIIKDKRFAFDKFQFHVPITVNFKAEGRAYAKAFNEITNKFIKANNIQHIIGIDRGERHLLYVSVIDLKGKIIEQFSLNEIVNEYNGNSYKTDYHALLDKKEDERKSQRQNWKAIENIKEFKQGYLSQVIHKICNLIVKYNAIVILEDLNIGFKQSRQKVEKSIYQQFEKTLIDKLNYFVDKKKNKTDIGGLLNALQLTAKFESFKKLDYLKQSGFLFYVPAWNTSKIDPITGFVNLFDCRYENVDKARDFFTKFSNIRFNKEKEYFEFEVKDYIKFNNKAYETRQEWIICTSGTRIEFKKSNENNNWDCQEITLTDEFQKLFNPLYNNIAESDNYPSLQEIILQQNEKSFFEGLLHLFKLTVQMRNSKIGTDIDYMISPVANENDEFYDSREQKTELPTNADANGAYNIARKGLMLVEKIKEASDIKKINLVITNKEYLQFVQEKNK